MNRVLSLPQKIRQTSSQTQHCSKLQALRSLWAKRLRQLQSSTRLARLSCSPQLLALLSSSSSSRRVSEALAAVAHCAAGRVLLSAMQRLLWANR